MPRISSHCCLVVWLTGLTVVLSACAPAVRGEEVANDAETIAARASALFLARCVGCHGDQKRESGLDMRSTSSILKGGESGPAIVPGDAAKSFLYERLESGEMPPRAEDRLNDSELALVRSWIEGGARASATDIDKPDDFAARKNHWSFQRPRRPDIPQTITPEQTPAENPIDAFVLTKLAELHLEAAPLSDRRTLARRAAFDLTGLPLTPERTEQFVTDSDPQAYAKLIDELLASPHYGERWARHWLDVARYADTGGYETDIYFKNAWRYRDYVVKSFNDDKPYDVFVREQIAGDEIWPDNLDLDGSYVMPPEKLRHLEAHLGTGLYALGPQIHESNMDAPKLRNERLSDWVDTTGAAFLGLTIACARCHDHKFDAISQRDYYGLQAVFAGSRQVEIPIVNAMEIADQKQHYPRILAVEEARRAYRLFEQSLAGRKPTDDEERRKQELLAAIGRAVLAVPEKAASTPGTPFDGLLEVPTASVLGHEAPELVPTIHLLSRGEVTRPKEVVTASLPVALAEQTAVEPVLPVGRGSRRALAEWLARPDHPLTGRVIVNRVWGWHFGRGLVATPNDFGRMGQAPSHPELLDWLATELPAQNWSIKSLHRLIMLSRTYQQASNFDTPVHAEIDPDNRYLWRMNRRRLEAEALWDNIHAVAGTLQRQIGGRPVMPPLAGEEQTDKANWVTSVDPAQQTRRGLYILVRRNFRFPLFDIFDAPVNAVSCAGRDVSTVAPQALWLLNNHVSHEQSRQFAERVFKESGAAPEARVQRAWQLALQRSPSPAELSEALGLLHSLEAASAPEASAAPGEPIHAFAQICLALLNLHEFVFVD